MRITIKKIKEKGFVNSSKIFWELYKHRIIPSYKKLYVFETPLKEKYPIKEYDKSITIEVLLDINDISEFAKLRGDWYHQYAIDLLEKKNICFIAKVDGIVVSCLWTSFNKVYFSDVLFTLKVEKDIAPLIDGYTLEEYRGKGIYKILWNTCINYLIDTKKYTKIYGFILDTNKRSLKVHSKLELNKIIMKIRFIKGFGVKINLISHLK
jgi:hypothetical protein